jgi:molybdopterin/thiamine biosynthesis adenylyltransferase
LELENRYIRNANTIDEEEQKKLKQSSVCVLGCGGLGGYTIEMLSRVGIGHLKVVDNDFFEVTNLNRQLLSTSNTLGRSKVIVAKERIHYINDEVEVIAIEAFIDDTNCEGIIKDCDVVIDALDSISTRKIVASACRNLGIPFVYGAIAGWYGQVSTIMPNEHTLDILYPKDTKLGDEIMLGNPSFTPAVVAGIQVSETIKILLSKGELLTGSFMHIDLLSNEMEKIIFE